MSISTFDIEDVRRRFTNLGELAFLDGTGGTQVPDEVADAMADYLKRSSANVGAPYGTSRRTEAVIERSRELAARFLGCSPEETIFAANSTTMVFNLTRTATRDFKPGDEILVTKLEHDSNVAPWLHVAEDRGLVVREAAITDDLRIDLDDLTAKLTDRTKVVAFPWGANSCGTLTDAAAVCALAHEAGAIAWVDAVHYAAHGAIDVEAIGADVLVCSPYKFCGPHLGVAYGRRELLESWRPYKVRPGASEPLGHRFETGTLPHELLAGFVATIEYLDAIGGMEAIAPYEHELGQHLLDGLPEAVELYGAQTMEGRLPTYMLNVRGRSAEEVAVGLAERGVAAWHGNYYSLGVFERLGIESAVRVGVSHYNTETEIDLLLAGLADIA